MNKERMLALAESRRRPSDREKAVGEALAGLEKCYRAQLEALRGCKAAATDGDWGTALKALRLPRDLDRTRRGSLEQKLLEELEILAD